MNLRFFKPSVFVLFCFTILVLQILQILYLKRSFFITTFDASYWKDRYEHSQYVLPLSKRIIGDDGVYEYAGYRVMQGELNDRFGSFKPPLGIYLIGTAIVLVKNPAYYALFLGFGSIVAFFFICRRLIGKTANVIVATTMLSLDPLFYSQLWKAWVDIAQAFFLLIHVLFFLSTPIAKKAFLLALLCGLTLGFFAEVKPPLLLPVLFILETFYFFRKKFWNEYCSYLAGLFLGIFIPYFRYFQLGFSITDVVKVQKHLLSLYLQAQNSVHYDALWQVLLAGKFPEISSGKLIPVEEWSVLWPIIVLFALGMSVFTIAKKQKKHFEREIAFFLLSSLVIFTIVPFYTRYLIVLLPFLYLFSTKLISLYLNRKMFMAFSIIVLLYGVSHAWFYLHPPLEAMLSTFSYSISHQYFQDVYKENLTKEDQYRFTADQFRLLTQGTLEKATVKSIEIKGEIRKDERFNTQATVPIEITYKTQDLGSFTQRRALSFVKEDGEWKLTWDWNLILPDFQPGYTVVVKKDPGKRGSIKDAKGNILVEDKEGYLISVNASKIDTKKESEMLSLIGALGSIKPIHVQNAYLENALPNSYTPLVTTFTLVQKETLDQLLSYPGVSIQPYLSRIYSRGSDPMAIGNTFYEECCTRIYSSHNYQGLKGPEKDYNDILAGQSGGTIFLQDNRGNIVRKILGKEGKNGKDLTVLAL